MKGRRIVHVVQALFGFEGVFGGAERYAFELALAMSKLVHTKLIAFGSNAWQGSIKGLDVEVLTNWIPFGRFRFDPINPVLLERLSRCEVIHYHQTNTMMASLAVLLRRSSRRFLFGTPHGGNGLGLHRLFSVDRWYDGFLHVSEFSRRSYGHHEASRSTVIWGGVDTERFCPDDSISRSADALFVGRLLPHKGVNILLEALDRQTPGCIVGRRWRHANSYYDLLKSLAQNKPVRFIENAEDRDIIREYQRAMCVVLPSVYHSVGGVRHRMPELLGQTLLEGMACGTPVICTEVGGMPEVVEDGVTGFIVPPNDPGALGEKIRWFRNHPEQARRMGQKAREKVLSFFSWRRVAERCLEYYQYCR